MASLTTLITHIVPAREVVLRVKTGNRFANTVQGFPVSRSSRRVSPVTVILAF